MQNQSRSSRLPIGAVLKSPRNGFHHSGIVTGYDRYGRPLVTSSSKRVGEVAEEPLDVFTQGHGYEVYYKPDSQREGHRAARRIQQKIGEPYDVLSGNCEHLVTEAYEGKRRSPTLQLYVLAVILVFVIGMARSS